jgi:predicted nucleotidyltransferase
MPVTQAEIERAVASLREAGATRVILFGSALDCPEKARDLDLACDGIEGWKFFEVGARLEKEVSASVDLIPLSPASRFTRYIERTGRILYERH